MRGEGRRLHCLPRYRGDGRRQGVLLGGRKAPWEPREVRRSARECPGAGAACRVPGGKPRVGTSVCYFQGRFHCVVLKQVGSRRPERTLTPYIEISSVD